MRRSALDLDPVFAYLRTAARHDIGSGTWLSV
jgi:hypothetical protein